MRSHTTHRAAPLVAVAAALLALAGAAGCGKAQADKTEPAPSAAAAPAQVQPKAEPAVVVPPAAPVKPAQHVEIEIASVANTMTFDKKSLSVPTGAEVHVVLNNRATMDTLPHNWVLVKTGTEASVAAAGLTLGEPAGYIDVRDKDALAHTPLAKPGQTTEVTFTAPEPGTYPYICTVPGHYLMMKGVLTVTP